MANKFNQPLGGNEMPRFAGPASMFRLPVQPTAEGLDVAIVGVPLDIGTSNRTGSRYGPRQIRAESVLVRPYGMATRAAPFDSFQVADIGDVALNTFSLEKSIAIIEQHYDQVLASGVKTVSLGGDHTIALPILRAQHKVHGPMALVHVDAHADVNDEMFGEKVTHGTIFRRAIEEGLVDPAKMVQIGLRATGYAADDFDWTRQQGVQVVTAEECWYQSLQPLMQGVRDRTPTLHTTFPLSLPAVLPPAPFGNESQGAAEGWSRGDPDQRRTAKPSREPVDLSHVVTASST